MCLWFITQFKRCSRVIIFDMFSLCSRVKLKVQAFFTIYFETFHSCSLPKKKGFRTAEGKGNKITLHYTNCTFVKKKRCGSLEQLCVCSMKNCSR